jgi:hypothetical protein
MYPFPLPKGLIFWKKDGCAVDKSGSPVRRDQPMLLRELRKVVSLEDDILVMTKLEGFGWDWMVTGIWYLMSRQISLWISHQLTICPISVSDFVRM